MHSLYKTWHAQQCGATLAGGTKNHLLSGAPADLILCFVACQVTPTGYWTLGGAGLLLSFPRSLVWMGTCRVLWVWISLGGLTCSCGFGRPEVRRTQRLGAVCFWARPSRGYLFAGVTFLILRVFLAHPLVLLGGFPSRKNTLNQLEGYVSQFRGFLPLTPLPGWLLAYSIPIRTLISSKGLLWSYSSFRHSTTHPPPSPTRPREFKTPAPPKCGRYISYWVSEAPVNFFLNRRVAVQERTNSMLCFGKGTDAKQFQCSLVNTQLTTAPSMCFNAWQPHCFRFTLPNFVGGPMIIGKPLHSKLRCASSPCCACIEDDVQAMRGACEQDGQASGVQQVSMQCLLICVAPTREGCHVLGLAGSLLRRCHKHGTSWSGRLSQLCSTSEREAFLTPPAKASSRGLPDHRSPPRSAHHQPGYSSDSIFLRIPRAAPWSRVLQRPK